MAYNSYTTEEDLKKQQQQAGNPAQPAQPAESTTLVSSNSDAAQAASQPASKGTGWTNLQTYLDNNAGQGAATTKRVLDPKQTQIDGAVTSLNQEINGTNGTGGVKKDIADGTVKRNTGLESKLKTDPVNAVNDFKSYTSSAYTGPASYTPSSDVYGKFNKITPKVKAEEITDPKAIGKSIGDTNYSFGMGALDGYLMNSEGQGAINSYNEKNKNVLSDRDSSIKAVNDLIEPAKTTSATNIGYAKTAADTAYNDWLETAKEEGKYGKDGYDAQRKTALEQVESKFKESGIVTMPKSFDTWVSDNSEYSWKDAVEPATLAALNALAGIDSDSSTNSVTKGNNSAVKIDWDALDKYIAQASKSIDGGVGPIPGTGVKPGATVNPLQEKPW